MLSEAAFYARLTMGYAAYRWSPKTPDPVARIREQLRHREQRFLQMARLVLQKPGNVYQQLFELAGCTYADLESSVQRHGLRETLQQLHRADVYLTFSEFRGVSEIVRSGRRLRRHDGDLANPWGKGWISHATSGSTGGRKFVASYGRRLFLHREGYEVLNANELDIWSRPRVLISSPLPSAWPFRYLICSRRIGMPIDDWFLLGGHFAHSAAYKAMTHGLATQIRLSGCSIPAPQVLPENDFLPAARRLADYVSRGRPPFCRGVTTPVARVAAAAKDAGLDLSGTVFSVGGEALTAAKRALIESVGAVVAPQYQSVEYGPAGFGCRQLGGDAVHLFHDASEFISMPRKDAGHSALYGSNLLLEAPFILINIEVDDSAVLEDSSCDCEFGRAGFHRIARKIVSYGKVKGQGITLIASDLISLLEQSLPAQFGGAPGDYQLAEIELGVQTQMRLRVSPRVPAPPLDEIRAFALDRVSRLYGGHLSVKTWSFSNGFEVVIEEPETTDTGKSHPLRLLGE